MLASYDAALKINSMQQELVLRIVLESPPANVDFALQKGSGSVYEIIQSQRSKGSNLTFDVPVKIKTGSSDSSEVNFVGPFVQGTLPDKFIYINIGTYAGQKDSMWSRRLKIPLKGITPEMITKAQSDTNCILQTHVAGTGKDGGPNCATVKPFAGWQIEA